MILLVNSMREYLKPSMLLKYAGVNWFMQRIKESSSWNALAIVLLAGAVYFLVYPTICIFLSAACALRAFVLKDDNVN